MPLIELLEMIRINPEKESGLRKVISNFYCSKNQDIENFLKKGTRGHYSTAVMLEEKEITRTYFVINNEIFEQKKEILGYFSVTLKTVEFADNISRGKIKKIDGISGTRDSTVVYLIAQLGKNDLHSDKIDGSEILNLAINTIEQSKRLVGGRTIMVECENVPSLIDFYKKNGFEFLQQNKELLQFIKNYYI